MTIKDIAALAGVSMSTVSKIVNNKDSNINQETRERVLRIVKEYNYAPYAAAKSAAGTRTFILGVLLKNAPKTNQLMNGILEEAQDRGYSIMIYDSCQSMEKELKNITSLCRNHVDGVIWEPVDEASLDNARHLVQADIRYCLMNAPSPVPCFRIDYKKMGYVAAKALVDHRHTRLGCLVKEDSRRSALVFEGFRQCMFDYKIPYNDKMRIIANDGDWYSGICSHLYTGVVSSHYHSSLLLLEQMDRLRYRIPFDLSLVSLRDDVREAATFPKISSIRIPYREFGRFLCGQIIELCEKKENDGCQFETDCSLENTFSLDTPLSRDAKKVLVVGSINIDITLNVDDLPQSGNTMITDKCSVIPGGKGANQAVGAAKLGGQVTLIGKVGNDFDAALVYSTMEDHRVNSQGITRDFSTETGKAYIHLRNDGESTITILTGANKMLTPRDIRANERLFEDTGYCLLQTEIPLDTVIEAARTAKLHGSRTILKPAAIGKLPEALMPSIDIFIPNKREAQLLCPRGSLEEKAEYFMEKGAGSVIITLGHSGCYVRSRDVSRHFPAVPFKAADTTGAADAFISALSVYLLNGYTLEKAVQIATCAAGFCVSRQGVIPALIDKNSLETYIKNTRPELLWA